MEFPPAVNKTFTKWNHFRSSRSRLSWNERNAPLNFFNIHNCQTIQLNYQIFFCDSPQGSSSTRPAEKSPSATGQRCAASVGTSAGFPLTDSSLMESSWSLPTCGESPGNNPTKSPAPLNTSEPEVIQSTIHQSLFNA